VEAAEGERRPGTGANEALQSVPVGGLDADPRIQVDPATVIPGEHIPGLVRVQEAVAAEPSRLGGDGAERSQEAFRETIE